MLRSIARLGLAPALAWALGASGAAAQDIYINASNTDHAYIAQYIGGDLVRTYTAHKGYQEPELTWVDEILPSWVIQARQADLYVRYGLRADVWADTVIEASRNPAIQFGQPGHLDPARGIEALEVPRGPVDRRLGRVHIQGNPHYLLDPHNARPVARTIARRMQAIWPEHADSFQSNLDDFLARLERKLSEWEERAAPLEGRNLATYHRTWTYFTERYGIDVVGVCEPKPGISPTPADLQTLIAAMRETRTTVLIKAPVYSERWPDYVDERLDHDVNVLTLGAHVGGDEGIDTYFALFDYLIDNLRRAYGVQ